MPRPLLWPVFSALLLLSQLKFGQTKDDNHNIIQKLYVFSNLQSTDESSNTLLAPNPVGMELVLTCQTLGKQTYWFEKTTNSGPQKMETDDEVRGSGLRLSLYRIPSLSSSDDGRELMCMMDGSTVKKEVTLDVVDRANITAQYDQDNSTKMEGELRCTGYGLNHQVELCWFQGEERKVCKGPDTPDEPGTVITTMKIDFSMVALHEKHATSSASYVCKAQLKSDIDMGALTNKTLDYFQTLFQATAKEMLIISEEVDPSKCDAKHHDKGDTHGSVLYVKQANFDTCRKVVITERTEPKATARTTTKPPPPSSTPTTTYETTSVGSNMKQTELATFAVAFMVYVMTGYLSRLVL